MMKQKVPQEFWDELYLKLRRFNTHMKALPKPAKTMDERRVTALLANQRKEDAKLKRRNPVSDFMIKQMALDEEKRNSPAYKALVANRSRTLDPIASSEEE